MVISVTDHIVRRVAALEEVTGTASSTVIAANDAAAEAAQLAFNAQQDATAAANAASAAQSTANTAQTTGSTAQSTANTANSTANTANSAAGSAQSTANSASSAAGSAQTTANTANSTANTASSAASSAQSTANSANTAASNAQSTANSANTAASNAATAAANASSAATAAQNAANTAQSTANGRNKVYRQSSTPPVGVSGDTWFNTVEDNKPYVSNGSSWVETGFGKLAIGALTAAHIATGDITALNYYTAAANIPRLAIGPAFVANGFPSIYWDMNGDGVVSTVDPRIYVNPNGSLVVSGGTSRGDLTLDSSSSTLRSAPRADLGTSFFTVTPTSIKMEYDAVHSLTMGNASIALVGGLTITSGTLFAVGISASQGIFGASVGAESLKLTDGTSGPANVSVGPSGILKRFTPASTMAVKRDIDILHDAELDPSKLYSIPIRQFKYKEDFLVATDQRSDVILPGFIAEEIAEIYPAASERNEHNKVYDWNHRYLIPGMLALIQEQHNRLCALESK